jgi:hypothetical protein
MRVIRESETDRRRRDALSLAAGAMVGLAIGFALSRIRQGPGFNRAEFRERIQKAVRRLRPARMQRLVTDQEEMDRLEREVVDEFLRDDVLSELPLDIGAISIGIIELSGEVASEDEVQRAVATARRVAGVLTVVNRIDVGSATASGSRRGRFEIDEASPSFAHQEGRVGGMGRRRQSPETDPDRPDDSQRLRENALAAADREQWLDEGYAPISGKAGETSGMRDLPESTFAGDEMDNQDPGGGGRAHGEDGQQAAPGLPGDGPDR